MPDVIFSRKLDKERSRIRRSFLRRLTCTRNADTDCGQFTKQASRFNRRLLKLFPNRVVDSKLLDMLFTRHTIPYGFRGVGKADRAAYLKRNSGLFGGTLEALSRLYRAGFYSKDDVIQTMRQRMSFDPQRFPAHKDWLHYREISSRILPRNMPVRDLANRYGVIQDQNINAIKEIRKNLRIHSKKMDQARRDIVNAPTDAPISATEFMKINPYGKTVFKGGKFNNQDWKICDPAWFSGRPSIALGYAINPTTFSPVGGLESLIHTARLRDIGAYRRGSAFFTPHVADGNRRMRLNRMADEKYFHQVPTPADRFSDYEIVVPGGDVIRLPITTYKISRIPKANGPTVRSTLDMPDTAFSDLPFTFSRIKDQGEYSRLLGEHSKLQKNNDNLIKDLLYCSDRIADTTKGALTHRSISNAAYYY